MKVGFDTAEAVTDSTTDAAELDASSATEDTDDAASAASFGVSSARAMAA